MTATNKERPKEVPDRILVVDDSAATVEVLQRNLVSRGYVVFTANSVSEAVAVLNKTSVDLVVTDMKMPQSTGIDLIRHVRENYRDMQVMMITGFPSISDAVEAVKLGAEDYLPKPFTDEELFAAVERSLERGRANRAGRRVALQTRRTPNGLLGDSSAMQIVHRMIQKAADSTATVLITGESGTGKELVARAIHYCGPRAAAAFVPVNCGGIPENLLESELFGHMKGAFTGATESRAGFFQTADGGTIFLDEIGEMSPTMQVKLLRVLQDREVYMVGSTRANKVDVRIVAATNKDLSPLVARGGFRDDLFYRLNVIPIQLPPLRDRDDDLLMLVEHFAARFSEEAGRPKPAFSPRALEALRGYHWPGNVRELENVIHRLVVMCESEVIDAPDLPELMRFSALRGGGLNRTLRDIESEHIRLVLSGVNGNKSQAARILGIDRKTLREKLKSLDIPDSE
ncbi:MAG: sigma-54-dependent Fis family transcriptional regulator [Phycisphaerae bacterium]|nr:sigma-54-dependent Fis family transcriptional regulator [Phycisphaerae bacterium]